jgi:methionyl-tRNA formyltransferase
VASPGRARRGVASALRTVYLGTSGFAATVLERLAASPHRPRLVVTPPDRPKGRGRKVAPPPAAEAARALGIELLQTASVNTPEATAAIQACDPEAPVVCAFGQLIGAELLAGSPILNVHPSLLPRWRGAAPIERALMAGDAETGVSIMRIGEGLDDGPVALREAVAIEPDDDFASLEARLAELAAEMLVRALDLAERAELEWVDQDDGEATYAAKIAPEDRRLDPQRPAAELERRVRALTPHVGAYLELGGGERLGVRAASVRPGGGEPGAIGVEEGELILGCAEGALRIDRVLPAGGREMSAAEYLRGHSPSGLAP